jgi:hypothetical protein
MYLVSQLLSLDLEVRGFFLYILGENYIEMGLASYMPSFTRIRNSWF